MLNLFLSTSTKTTNLKVLLVTFGLALMIQLSCSAETNNLLDSSRKDEEHLMSKKFKKDLKKTGLRSSHSKANKEEVNAEAIGDELVQDSRFTMSCEDNPLGWYDADGPVYNCAWYAKGSNCANFGHLYANFGKTANQACCVCGGGDGEVNILSNMDNFCVDILASDASEGVGLALWGCNGGKNQKFLFPTGSTGVITSVLDSSKCIAVGGGDYIVYKNGVPITLALCNSSKSTQQWQIKDGTIRSVGNPNYCWDGNGKGQGIYLWNCDGSSDQKFTTI